MCMPCRLMVSVQYLHRCHPTRQVDRPVNLVKKTNNREVIVNSSGHHLHHNTPVAMHCCPPLACHTSRGSALSCQSTSSFQELSKDPFTRGMRDRDMHTPAEIRKPWISNTPLIQMPVLARVVHARESCATLRCLATIRLRISPYDCTLARTNQ